MITRNSRYALLAAAALAAISLPTLAAAQSDAPSGRLSCNVGAGIGLIVTSQRPMDCRFTPRRGPVQRYTGVIRNFGLDLGTIRATSMTWRVYGTYPRAPHDVLAGSYGGATAGASIVRGASGNLLVGGQDNRVTLQPLSLQGSRGVNVAVGVQAFELTSVRPAGRRR